MFCALLTEFGFAAQIYR